MGPVTNRYLTVGYAVADPAALDELVRLADAAGAGEPLLDGGRFVRCHDEASGARLNVMVGPDGRVRSVKPSFRPEDPCLLRARLTGLLPDGVDADADVVQLAPRHGSYPLAVEFEAGSLAVNRLPFGEEVELEVVGFAHTMECYPHEDAYLSSGIPLRMREVLPAGLVPLAADRGATRSRATALVSGVVVAVSRRRNAVGGGEFLHLVIDTEGMVLDAVVCPDAVEGPPVEPGRIVTGSMWFVARCREAIPATVAAGDGSTGPAASEPVPSVPGRVGRSRLFGRQD